MSLHQISDHSFNADVINSDTPVLVDFWAEWCGPCKMITPILEDVAQTIGDKVKVVKMNIDENPDTPAKLGIRSIPTLAIFKGGQAISTKVGVLDKVKVIQWIEEVI